MPNLIRGSSQLSTEPMRATEILEPGLLRAFRWVNLFPIFIPICSLMLMVFTGNLFVNPVNRNLGLLLLCIELVRLLYLFWPTVHAKLGKAFFPIACILTFTIPTLLPFLGLLRQSEAENGFLHLILIFIYQFVVTVFIAWQYNMRVIALLLAAVLSFDSLYVLAGTFSGLTSIQVIGIIGLHLLAFLFISSIITYLVNNLRAQRDALIMQNEQLTLQSETLEQLSRTQERNRLARELHHTMVHYMSGAVLQLNGIKSQWTFNPEKAQSMLDVAINSLTEGLQETRKAIQAIRDHPTEAIGLQKSLKLLLSDFSERTGIKVQSRFESLSMRSDKERMLYRLTEEALRNIEKHAFAKQVKVVLEKEGAQLSVTIKDDGQGFQVQEVDQTQSFGLQSMQEWAELMQGSFNLKTEYGTGTTIQVSIPLDDD